MIAGLLDAALGFAAANPVLVLAALAVLGGLAAAPAFGVDVNLGVGRSLAIQTVLVAVGGFLVGSTLGPWVLEQLQAFISGLLVVGWLLG